MAGVSVDGAEDGDFPEGDEVLMVVTRDRLQARAKHMKGRDQEVEVVARKPNATETMIGHQVEINIAEKIPETVMIDRGTEIGDMMIGEIERERHIQLKKAGTPNVTGQGQNHHTEALVIVEVTEIPTIKSVGRVRPSVTDQGKEVQLLSEVVQEATMKGHQIFTMIKIDLMRSVVASGTAQTCQKMNLLTGVEKAESPLAHAEVHQHLMISSHIVE